ncbi:hypothetical protein HDU98_004681 [Podochytrium sp. JEL0797]|nr:hypothetical protein HDU98_004681 [Podochytrium sp. JEL0797]
MFLLHYISLVLVVISNTVFSSKHHQLRQLRSIPNINPTAAATPNQPELTPHPQFPYKDLLASSQNTKTLHIPEWYYHNATLAEFFSSTSSGGADSRPRARSKRGLQQIRYHQKVFGSRPIAPVGEIKTVAVDDGVYAGENEVPYLTAPGYRVFRDRNVKALQNDVTLFTQLSLNRYVCLNSDLKRGLKWQAKKELPLLATHLETLSPTTSNGRTVTLSLLFGVEFLLKSSDPNTIPEHILHHPYDLLYPINALRNLAVRESRTAVVFSLDADFVPSRNAWKELVGNTEVMERVFDLERPGVVVVAAFEEVEQGVVVGGKGGVGSEELETGCVEGKVVPFHFKVNPGVIGKQSNKQRLLDWCHGDTEVPPKGMTVTAVQGHTNFTRWFKAKNVYEVRTVGSVVAGILGEPEKEMDDSPTSGEHAKYKSQEKPLVNAFYEPYFIARRSILPLFDESFRGYSFNKRSHSIEMQLRGVRMHVAPRVFVLHRWHGESSSRKEWKVDTAIAKKTVDRTYRLFLTRVKRQYRDMWRIVGRVKKVQK